MTCRSNAIFRPMEDRDRPAVLALSKAWAEENITYGYFANGDKELDDYRCWVAEVGGRVAGYAAGQMETAGRDRARCCLRPATAVVSALSFLMNFSRAGVL